MDHNISQPDIHGSNMIKYIIIRCIDTVLISNIDNISERQTMCAYGYTPFVRKTIIKPPICLWFIAPIYGNFGDGLLFYCITGWNIHYTRSFQRGKTIELFFVIFQQATVHCSRVVLSTTVWLWICSFIGFNIIYWLVVWNIFYFPIYWVSNHPNWLIFFQRGGPTTNQYSFWWRYYIVFTPTVRPWQERFQIRLESILIFDITHPIGSMYGIFTNMYPKNHPNVGKYSIHGSYGHWTIFVRFLFKTGWFCCLRPLSAFDNLNAVFTTEQARETRSSFI